MAVGRETVTKAQLDTGLADLAAEAGSFFGHVQVVAGRIASMTAEQIAALGYLVDPNATPPVDEPYRVKLIADKLLALRAVYQGGTLATPYDVEGLLAPLPGIG